ncbi:hypothetical protein HPB49_015210 [Dermacentor silvarum]|uniref:Uncharacterized protein n=1 Tax=Dermacentor silvarum TaxID=543639 RepID=A0ACB8DDW4_DERSI|nr:hypothetical protein HPB49_015210 [Dermacentor silvarum]
MAEASALDTKNADGRSSATTEEDMDLTGPSTNKTDGIKPTTTQCETIERTTTEDDWHTLYTATAENIRQATKKALAQPKGMEECETACDRMCIMVAGQMTCLGTLPHLRDKFGTGYTMQLVMAHTKPPAGEVESADIPMEGKASKTLDEKVANLFPGVRVLGKHDNVHTYHVKEKLPWSIVFEKVEELEESHTFRHVMVQDTNLEQIFIAFAEKQGAPGPA